MIYPLWGSSGHRLTLTPTDQLQILPSAFGQGHWLENQPTAHADGGETYASTGRTCEHHTEKAPALAGFEPRTFLRWPNRIANRKAELPTGAPEFQRSFGQTVCPAVLCRLTYLKFCWGLYTTVMHYHLTPYRPESEPCVRVSLSKSVLPAVIISV